MSKSMDRRRALKLLGSAGAAAALPAAMSGCGRRAPDAQVIVIGAGLAGLNAALLLEQQGADVLVLEGSDRIGGRVYTHRDGPDYVDTGGSELSVKSYARVLDMVERLEIEMLPWAGKGIEFAYHVNEQTVAPADWPTSPANKLSGPARNAPPLFLNGMLLPRPSPLAHPGAWLEPAAAEYDVPFGAFLRENGADAEMQRLIGSSFEADALDDVSLLWRLRAQKFNEVSGGLDDLRNIDGGMGRVTDGMAGLLQRQVRMNTEVVGIRTHRDGVEIEDGAGSTYRAQFAVCTIPIPLLRRVKLDPILSGAQETAVQNMPYGNHTDVFLNIVEPFWEKDGLPSSLWTDTSIGTVLRMSWGDIGYLWLAINGPANMPWRNGSDEDVMQGVMAELGRIRPSTVGSVEPIVVQNWSRDPWTRGHLAYMGPGQVTEFGAALTQPHGRVYFAGEHTSQTALGMEGAMESGERAAVDILLQL
ncbi:MAG: flavin monoamine oxidase family protein [Gammaproteobacteria bacterium]